MMKRIVSCALIIVLTFSFLAPAQADAMRKLGRGLANCVTFPIEIPEQVKRTNYSDGPMAALTYGFIKGLAMMCTRLVVGVYEVVTFPVPVPKDYQPILTDPEFFFEETSW